jgi:diaminohydroxyphosphoribosylaminopyrimidine deaminase/5-amino-6-(5-phosphoribosylamino)uracil reductase
MWPMTNEELIRKTLELARQGEGKTFPNPMVGAVIVKDGKIISTGYHHRHGEAHAELDAINNADQSLEGATIYVSLEPCCHTNKKTPPCAQRLILERFKKVVICNLDPNPSVNGKGVQLLRENGIIVEHGVLEEEGERLNEVFFYAQRNKKPFVHLKLATTLDGKISMPSGESQWITGPKAREEVHILRSHSQAVMVGAETVRADNPKLNVRLENFTSEQPYRIIFTKTGNLPASAHVFTDELKARTIIYSMVPLPMENVMVIKSLDEAMEDLFNRHIISVFLEGGATLTSEFMKAGLVNRVSMFLNPSFLGTGKSAVSDFGLEVLNERPHLTNIESRWIEGDFLITGRLK